MKLEEKIDITENKNIVYKITYQLYLLHRNKCKNGNLYL